MYYYYTANEYLKTNYIKIIFFIFIYYQQNFMIMTGLIVHTEKCLKNSQFTFITY